MRLPTTRPIPSAKVDDEVGEGNHSGLANGCGGADGSDAEHDGAEDHRGDHHLDQVDEHGAQDFEALGVFGVNETEGDAGDDGNDHCDVEPV